MNEQPATKRFWFECSCGQVTPYTKENVDEKFKAHMAHDCEKVMAALGPEEI